MTDDEALHIVRNSHGHSVEKFREARVYLCDRFEQVKRELHERTEFCENLKGYWQDLRLERDEADKLAASAMDRTNEVMAERDNAQRIASLALDVEGWLFRTVDALTDNPTALPERVQSDLMGVYNDMVNARENRKAGG